MEQSAQELREYSGRVFIGLGGNLGGETAVLERFREAVARLRAAAPATTVSSLYRSAPVGPVAEQAPFLNAVVALEPLAPVDPEALVDELLALEAALGRERESERPFGPRALDLDLLAVGGVELATPTVELPHPRAADRAFVLLPLAELAGLAYRLPGDRVPLAGHLARPEVRDQQIERIAPPRWLLAAGLSEARL